MNIALDDIRSKAPEGATHYNQSDYYFKDINGTSCEMWDPYNQQWFKTYVSVFDTFKPLN